MSEGAAWAANCSMLFRERPLLERPEAAFAAGFDAIEFWWPFSVPVPSRPEVDAFVGAVERSGVRLVALNLWAGDLAGADCGVASLPDRSEELVSSLDVATRIGDALGVTAFNALYGNRDPAWTSQDQDRTAMLALGAAAEAAAGIGASILVEPISGPKPYPLRTSDHAASVVDQLRTSASINVGLLCDVYHLAANGDDPVAAIERHGQLITHVQVADHPGRHEPGTGSIDLNGCLSALDRVGFDGWIGLEYLPSTTTEDGLGHVAELGVPLVPRSTRRTS
ncbi:TIM barrel protein [Nocardioides sp. 616]|uniref:hydroxypyruvate isomerase family protein n=1 Tax=Nocardioides sp. 616 TaxID=2268090 RepID=UPI000CE55AFA|nr:TIM barrel protein [Nocardioides sp. 616]